MTQLTHLLHLLKSKQHLNFFLWKAEVLFKANRVHTTPTSGLEHITDFTFIWLLVSQLYKIIVWTLNKETKLLRKASCKCGHPWPGIVLNSWASETWPTRKLMYIQRQSTLFNNQVRLRYMYANAIMR